MGINLFNSDADDVALPSIAPVNTDITKEQSTEETTNTDSNSPDSSSDKNNDPDNEEIDLTKSYVDLNKTIMGEKVKTILIKEDVDIYPNNYVLDFSDIASINAIQKDVIKSLVSVDGDIKLYLYKKDTGLTSFGMGSKFKLETMIPLVKQYVFSDEIKVYKDFQVGEKIQEVVSRDITKLRMNL